MCKKGSVVNASIVADIVSIFYNIVETLKTYPLMKTGFSLDVRIDLENA